MKYIILLCDGMSDYPLDELGGKTPMEAARKPNLDRLASLGKTGLVKTVADGLSPGSDVANLSVMGYDPAIYYSGRSPLEAVSMGIPLARNDLVFRCNLVTLSDEPDFSDKTMIDYCAGDISSEEAAKIIQSVNEALGNQTFEFFPGVSYRHCLVCRNMQDIAETFTPPHDISGKVIGPYLASSPLASPFTAMMNASYSVLKDHPVNLRRIADGKRPANAIWLWGQGRKPQLSPFKEKFGISGGVVSAVDLIKGIGKCAGMTVANVEGATGYIDTNFEGKAAAALALLDSGIDLVYIHIEAPDECGHRFEIDNKVRAIELIDRRTLAPLLKGLEKYDHYKIMALPDHPTPLSTKTHASDPVPFMIYEKQRTDTGGVTMFSEKTAGQTGLYIDKGHTLMDFFIHL